MLNMYNVDNWEGTMTLNTVFSKSSSYGVNFHAKIIYNIDTSESDWTTFSDAGAFKTSKLQL